MSSNDIETVFATCGHFYYNTTHIQTGDKLTALDLREIGSSQRLMLWAILAWFIGFFPPAMFITIPFQLYCVYRLSRSLQLNVAMIVAALLLTFVPLICVTVFIVLNQRAINELRRGGIRAGWMGARKEDL